MNKMLCKVNLSSPAHNPSVLGSWFKSLHLLLKFPSALCDSSCLCVFTGLLVNHTCCSRRVEF